MALLFGFFFIFLPSALAQKPGAREARLLARAEALFDKRDFASAIPVFKTILERNPKNGHAWMLLGESGLEMRDTVLAEHAFREALGVDSLRFSRALAILGQLYLEGGKYVEASDAFKKAIGAPGFRESERTMLIKRLETSELRRKLIESPHAIVLTNSGTPLNSAADEIPNSILLDGSLMLFTRKEAGEGRGPRSVAETFLVAQRTENGWSVPQDFVPWQTDDLNMGAPVFSPDGNLLWFAGCGWPGGMGSCDLYLSEYKNGKWSQPVNAGSEINSAAWDSQPAISADGMTLIFSSNRPGGFGGSDLYRSVRLPDGQWSRPANLGPLINTQDNEMSPFFHPDGRTLYFSSNGHPGMGSYDLFMTKLDDAGRWSKPQNLGVPLNSAEDELNIIVDANGGNGWIAARKKGGFGGYDIYEFTMPEELKPRPLRTVKIVVADAETARPVPALVSVNSLVDGSLLFEGKCRDTDGQLLLPLPLEARFALFAGSEGYLYFSDNFDFSADSVSTLLTLEIKLIPASEGNNLIINNIYFAFNSAELLPESYPALRHLLAFMIQNPQLHIEISGHTDNVGSAPFNQRLSLQRAEAVTKWLMENGINQNRIVARGYGSTRPIATNNDEQGRALNRRTEVKILKNK